MAEGTRWWWVVVIASDRGGRLRGAWRICLARAEDERGRLVKSWLGLAMVGGRNREAGRWGRDCGGHGARSARVGDV